MPTRDPRIDAYIAKSADFAKPILMHLRDVVHTACPDVEETMKWSFPHFMYEGILCSMASFKQHCAFGFWKGSLIVGKNGDDVERAMGQFGRITDVAELPSDRVLTGYVKQAMKLNETGVKSPTRQKPTTAKPALVVPAELTAALKKNKRAMAGFESFSPSQQREYADWISEAKGADTRQRRLATAVEWMAEGKTRNWKYEKC